MAADDSTPNTVPTVPPEVTTSEVDKAIPGPEEVHEKPGSISSNDSGDVDLEKQQAKDGMSTAEPVKSEAESVYPGTKQTALVMTSICLTIFPRCFGRSTLIAHGATTDHVLGPSYHSDGHPQND